MDEALEQQIAGNLRTSNHKDERIAIEALAHKCEKSEIRAVGVKYKIIKPWSDQEAREFLKSGKTNMELADIYGFDPKFIADWRKNRGEPVNKDRPSITGKIKSAEVHRSRIDDEKVMALYNEGKSDPMIAKELGMSANTVLHWRKTHGLESKRAPVKKANDREYPASGVRSLGSRSAYLRLLWYGTSC